MLNMQTFAYDFRLEPQRRPYEDTHTRSELHDIRLEPKYGPEGWKVGVYLVEWTGSFAKVCFGAFDIIGHDIGDGYARV